MADAGQKQLMIQFSLYDMRQDKKLRQKTAHVTHAASLSADKGTVVQHS
jgi:hypothetical protein